MRTEIIEKLKVIENFFTRTNDKESKEVINEAIALLEKPRVSAEEVLKLQQSSLKEYINKKHTQEECIGFIDGFGKAVQAMHDYAGQSDAVEFVKWLRKNKFHYIESDNKYAKFGARHILFTIEELYQAFLNREEK
jgi:hypothetical protein